MFFQENRPLNEPVRMRDEDMLRPCILVMLSLGIVLAQDSRLSAQPDPASSSVLDSESPLVTQPTNHEERFEAMQLLVNLGRYDLARGYLRQILEADPSDEELLALRDQFGTVELFRLSRITELLPLSQNLVDRVNAASRRQAMDPARIDRILQDLDGTTREREFALLELRNIGILAVPRLLQHMADPRTDLDRDRIVYVLTRMGRQILPAMIGAIDADNTYMKTGVLEVIGLIGDSSATDALWYPAFSPEEEPAVQTAARVALARILFGSAEKTKLVTSHGVTARIKQNARDYFYRLREIPVGEEGKVTVWKWDSEQTTVVPFQVTPEAAGNDAALKFSRQALALSGEDEEVQALYLAAAIADAGYRTGWQEALPTGPGTAFNLALTAGLPVLSRVFDLSLEAGRTRVAETAMTALSLVGSQNLLRHSQGRQSTLIRGLNASDRRVQFAAAVGVLQLAPKQSFPHASRVIDILVQALNDDGQRKVLVIDPNVDRGRALSAAVSQMGYQQEAVKTGKQGFVQASERGDIALVMLHVNCVDWELSQTIANLRADARTAGLPIVIYGPTFLEDEHTLDVQRTPRSMYMVYSDKRPEVERQLKPFLDQILSAPLTPGQRARRAQAAMYWLNRIADRHQNIFDIEPVTESVFEAINTPELAPGAINILATIGTARAQALLGEAVLSHTFEEELREQAALALALHVQRHGLLLEMEMVGAIKELWTSEPDPAVQTALAAFVGTLKASPSLVERRLKEFNAPRFPAGN